MAARKHDCEMGLIAASRYSTLKSHLKHWVAFIEKNTKVKDLKRKTVKDIMSGGVHRQREM